MKKMTISLIIVSVIAVFLVIFIATLNPYDIVIGRLGMQEENSRNVLFRINKWSGEVEIYQWVKDEWMKLGRGDWKRNADEVMPMLFRQSGSGSIFR